MAMHVATMQAEAAAMVALRQQPVAPRMARREQRQADFPRFPCAGRRRKSSLFLCVHAEFLVTHREKIVKHVKIWLSSLIHTRNNTGAHDVIMAGRASSPLLWLAAQLTLASASLTPPLQPRSLLPSMIPRRMQRALSAAATSAQPFDGRTLQLVSPGSEVSPSAVTALAVQLPVESLAIPPPCCIACALRRSSLLPESQAGMTAAHHINLRWLTGEESKPSVAALKFYKSYISPLIPPSCRFIPTCSEYGQAAFEQFTPAQAAVLTAWRIVRCNPLHWPGTGFGNDVPVWPPPPYWAGDGTLRTFIDDERSRRRAQGLPDEEPIVPPWERDMRDD